MACMATAPKTEPIHDVLETLLRVDAQLERMLRNRKYSDPSEAEAFDAELALIESRRGTLLGQLAVLITDAVGNPLWTVLVAGHLVQRHARSDEITIVPIEQVHHLDNLRRFP